MSKADGSENIGTDTVTLIEILRADRFTDISLAQWIAVTPRQIIKDTLMLRDSVIDDLTVNANKMKQYVVK